ncbi:MAG: glycosyltransferase family 39 protein [Cyanophyceae cyanobacterium]
MFERCIGLVRRRLRVRRWRWLAAIAWVVLIWAIAYGWQAGSMGLIDETEPLFVEAARQMTLTGDWITPYFNGLTRFDKPPLIYWLMAIAFEGLGVNEWTARLPSLLSALGLIAFVFATLWRFGSGPGDRAITSTDPANPAHVLEDFKESPQRPEPWQPAAIAAIGSGTVAFTPLLMGWGRTAVSDMLLTACIGAALLAFFWGYAAPEGSRSQRRWYAGFYGLVGLAVLAKGPVGVVLPALVVGIFLAYLGEGRSHWRALRPLRGLGMVTAIALPWFVMVTLANGQAYIDSFFGYHNFDRFTRVVNQHSAPIYFYVVVIALGFFPWSIFLPVALGRLRLRSRRRWQQTRRRDRLRLFAGIWFLVILGFFTIAVTKLPSYVLPLMPAAGILVALLWRDAIAGDPLDRPDPPRPGLVAPLPLPPLPVAGLGASGMVAVAISAIVAVALWLEEIWLSKIKDPTMPNLAEAIAASGIVSRGAWIWAIAAIIGAVLAWRSRHRWQWAVQFSAIALFTLSSLVPLGIAIDAQRQAPLRHLAATIVAQRQPGEIVLMLGFQKPSVAFYSRDRVWFSQRITPVVAAVRQRFIDPNAPVAIGDLPLPPLGPTLLILGDQRKLAEVNLAATSPQPLEAAGVYQLVRVATAAIANHQPPIDPND